MSGNTTSDHCSILSVLSTRTTGKVIGKSVHWEVFNLFTEYTFEFWENCWSVDRLNASYNDYIQFLGLLIARCTIFFPLNKYRVAIPAELRTFMSYVRALSFRQMRTKSVELKNEVRYLRKAAKSALRDFVSFQLYTTLQLIDILHRRYRSLSGREPNVLLNQFLLLLMHSSLLRG